MEIREEHERRQGDIHCEAHGGNMTTIADHDKKLAEIKGGQDAARYLLGGIGAAMLVLFSIAVGVMSSHYDKIQGSITGVSTEMRAFVLASTTDRTQIRSELSALRDDVNELKQKARR
jgi:hypothetical protein